MFAKIFSFKFIIRRPRAADVIIYDRVGSGILRRCLRGVGIWTVLDVRRVLYIHPEVLAKWIGLLIHRRFATSPYERVASLKVMNEYAALILSKPSVVMTYGENSERFGILSQMLESAHFMGIQNGLRGPRPEDIKFRLALKNCYCFGQDTIDKYKGSHQKINKFVITGSLKAALFASTEKMNPTGQFAICLISQYRPARFEDSLPTLKSITEVQIQWVVKYCEKQELKFCVAGSCKENNFLSEYRYFRTLIGEHDFVFFPNDDNGLSSYKAMHRSEVSITNHSTIGFEGLSMGLKVLFVNPTDDQYFSIPALTDNEMWRLEGSTTEYDKFARRVHEIRKMNSKEWVEQTKRYAKYFVSNEEAPADEIIRSKVRKTVGN